MLTLWTSPVPSTWRSRRVFCTRPARSTGRFASRTPYWRRRSTWRYPPGNAARCTAVRSMRRHRSPSDPVTLSPIELTMHAAAAGDHASATTWAALAGESALENQAPTEASRWFRTALDHAVAAGVSDTERALLEVRLGASQLRAGDPEARITLLSAAERARRTGADGALVDAVLAHDRGMMRIGSIDEELLAMIEAALQVADHADEPTFARLLALHGLHLVHTPRVEERLASADSAIGFIERSEDPLLLPRVISSLLFALSGPGTLDRRRELALRAVIAADRTDDPHLRFWTARAAHFVAIEAADPPMAAAQLRRMEDIARAIPETRLRWVSDDGARVHRDDGGAPRRRRVPRRPSTRSRPPGRRS